MVELSGITPGSTHLSGNDIWVTAQTSGIPAGATDYKILLKIVSVDGVLIGSPFEDAVAPDPVNQARFNISGYVDQGIERKLTWPIKTRYQGKVVGWVNIAYDVWLYPGESYIDANGERQESYGDPLQPIFIVPGRLPLNVLARFNAAETNWFEKFCQQGEFFSYMPETQQVTPFQPVKLWWIPPSELAVTIKLKFYLADGATGTIDLLPGILYYDILWETECHPVNAGIPYDGSRPVKYEVWIESAGEIVCAKRTFLINWNYAEKYYYLFVDNQIGGIECVSFTGRGQLKGKGERTIVSRQFPQGSGVQTRTRVPVARNRRRNWSINSGYKPKEELAALEFLLDSPNVWLALPPADGSTDIAEYSLVPVNIISSELVLNDDTTDVESIDIELEEAL